MLVRTIIWISLIAIASAIPWAAHQATTVALQNQWQSSMDAAAIAEKKGDLDDAERLLTTALGQAEIFGRNDQHVVQTLYKLGEV